jgi:hypothetical protein
MSYVLCIASLFSNVLRPGNIFAWEPFSRGIYQLPLPALPELPLDPAFPVESPLAPPVLEL